jgi:hypothetical protein
VTSFAISRNSTPIHPPHQDELGVQFLMAMDQHGQGTGVFRICILGGESLEVPFAAKHLFLNLPSELQATQFRLCVPTSAASPPLCRTTTQWQDIEDLIKENTLLVENEDGSLFSNRRFLEYLASGTDKDKPAASLRWAVGVSSDGLPQLELQTMPAPAKELNHNALMGDTSVSVMVGTYPLLVDMFANNVIDGPVPLIFAVNKEVALAKILQDQDALFCAISKINNQLLRMEHLNLSIARTFALSEACQRRGMGQPAYPLFAEQGGSNAKKARTSASSQPASGTHLSIPHIFCSPFA